MGLFSTLGMAVTAGTTAMSFAQAEKQKKAIQEAEKAASQLMNDARRRLEVNYADALSIQKEPYERQREALLSAGAQAMMAGTESDRGGAATAGRVLAAQTEAQGQIRDQMNKDLFDLEAMKAEEASRLRDINAQMDLQEVQGAQLEAAAAKERALLAENQGWQGATNLLGDLAEKYPTFGSFGTHSNKLLIPDNNGVDVKLGVNNPVQNATTPMTTQDYLLAMAKQNTDAALAQRNRENVNMYGIFGNNINPFSLK